MSEKKPLRDGRDRVSVITLNGETRPQLGISHPQEDNRRSEAASYWGHAPRSPRQQPLATVDEPLPVRTQTILSHELAPEIAQAVNSGVPLDPVARKPKSDPVVVSRTGGDAPRKEDSHMDVSISFDIDRW